MTRPLSVLLVDPSLFTAPYDAALTGGLTAAGVRPTWAVRPTRASDRQEIPTEFVDAFFYRHVDKATFLPAGLRKAAKGLSHAIGLARLIARVLLTRPDVVHFQWLVVPAFDVVALKIIGLLCPVILTVHDTVPFNGDRFSLLQHLAMDVPLRTADRLIVHTDSGRTRLLSRRFAADKVRVIRHGPLPAPAGGAPRTAPRSADRYTFVMFGEIKAYKGPDLLVEAVASLSPREREQTRFIIAGRPQMDLEPLRDRISSLRLQETVDLRPRRLSEQEMADLFAETDCFLFPYRQIDASGAYFMIKALGKWIIASRVGVFAEDVDDGRQGQLVPSNDVPALAGAISDAIARRPRPATVAAAPGWEAIGLATRRLYEDALNHRKPQNARGPSELDSPEGRFA